MASKQLAKASPLTTPGTQMRPMRSAISTSTCWMGFHLMPKLPTWQHSCTVAGWKAIPHRRRILRGAAQWRISAAQEPPEKVYRWQGSTIIVRIAKEDELKQEDQAAQG